MSKRFDEFARLDHDHPESAEMSMAEIHSRYWMYFGLTVALARLEVYKRRLLAPLERFVGRLSGWLETRFGR